LCTGSNGWKLDVVRFQCACVLHAAQHGQVDNVLVFRARGQCAGKDDIVRLAGGDGERIAQGELVLGERPGLVGAEHVHARQLLDGDELADDRLLLGQQAGAHRHRHGEHDRHRHGDGRHGQHERELQRGEDGFTAINAERDDDRDQRDREHD